MKTFGKLYAAIVMIGLMFVEKIAGRSEQYMQRHGLLMGFVTLKRSYAGYLTGTVVSLPKSTEDALVASGQASTSAGPVTAGAASTTMNEGMAAVAAGASSVVITNPLVTVSSRIFAQIAQTTADGTALYVTRVVPAAGSFTIFVNANATAATQVNWAIVSTAASSPT